MPVPRPARRRLWSASTLLLAVLLLAPRAFADLTADNLVLIVNRNEPAGRELADHYAQARGVPDGRIVELDLPTGDRLPRDLWDGQVVAPVRDFLTRNGLKQTVRCAVTFYGVPLAVEGITLDDAGRAERREVDADASALLDKFAPLVRRAEQITADLGNRPPPWPAAAEVGIDDALAHVRAAQQYLQQRADSLTPAQRRETAAKIAPVKKALEAPAEPGGTTLSAAELRALIDRHDAQGRRAARAALRTSVRLEDYATVLLLQQRTLDDADSDAGFDSELSTLWIDAPPRARWIPNPLAAADRAVPADAPAEGGVLMVARLDGRDPPQVRRLIDDALAVEAAGLAGKIVVDSRGLPPSDAYGTFDEQLRRLADFLKANADLPVVADDAPDVIAPLPGVDGVAVYVGWYSLTKYVPGLRFERGAVGYHVASLEMRSLRDLRQAGWVRGLLDDGVAGTLGAVSEPYLSAFPPPGRFVPLLLTGRLTLAETYWRTVPMLSWKMGLVGDPLYRPFAAKPALPADKLPTDAAALLK